VCLSACLSACICAYRWQTAVFHLPCQSVSLWVHPSLSAWRYAVGTYTYCLIICIFGLCEYACILNVFVSVCLHIYLPAFLLACILHVCLSVCLLASMSACQHVCLSACLLACMSARLLWSWLPVCISLCLHVCTNAYLHACMSAFICVCLPLCVCVPVRLCVLHAHIWL
jgi:hypothetical protein